MKKPPQISLHSFCVGFLLRGMEPDHKSGLWTHWDFFGAILLFLWEQLTVENNLLHQGWGHGRALLLSVLGLCHRPVCIRTQSSMHKACTGLPSLNAWGGAKSAPCNRCIRLVFRRPWLLRVFFFIVTYNLRSSSSAKLSEPWFPGKCGKSPLVLNHN